MPHRPELDTFRETWDYEAELTIKVLESLPVDQYDFRPDPKGRSLGEMAWHLAEGDAYMSVGLAKRSFDMNEQIPNLKRPREVNQLAPGYRRVHQDAVARLANLTNDQLDEMVPFFGSEMSIRHILWGAILHHMIHHRAQLMLLCRLAGGTPPGIYGPNREETEAMMQAR